MKFDTDGEALDFLEERGIKPKQGVFFFTKEEYQKLDTDIRAAISYLCCEWDYSCDDPPK